MGAIGGEFFAAAGDVTDVGGVAVVGDAAVVSDEGVWLAGGGLNLSLDSITDLSFSPWNAICEASSSASFVVSFDASVTGNNVSATLPQCGHFHSKDLVASTFLSSGV